MASLQGLRQQSVRDESESKGEVVGGADYIRFEGKFIPEPNSGCWLWAASASSAGYGQFYFDGRGGLAHRYSYQVHHGPIPEGMCVLHKCDNPPCVNPDHLFVGTHKDNAWDKVWKGRAKGNAGEGNHLARLDPEQVRWVRQAIEYGMTAQMVADVFGVHRSTILKIVDGVSWRHA